MSIPNQELGWSNESKLIRNIIKQLDKLAGYIGVMTGTIPTHLWQLIADSLHRTVTDAEKATWNGKQDDLGTDINDALTGANAPDAGNVFATMNDLPANELTADELAAIQGANTPNATNVFITENDISAAAAALLPSAATLVGTELIPSVQGGVFVTATPAQIKTYVNLNSANIWGYVTDYASLPLGITATDPEIGDLVGVNTTTGVWIIGTQRKQGFYKRSALTGVAATDYGTSPFSAYPPFEVTTATDTDINGLIGGNGTKVIAGTKAQVESILTGNIISHTHPYLPDSSIGAVNEVLHGNPGGALTWSPVVEADILLTAGNTTNNTIVGTHGFAPALSGVNTQFLRGDGAWASPAAVTQPNAYAEESFGYTADVAHNINHNFGARPLVQVINASGEIEIPIKIHHVDTDNVEITVDTSATFDVILTLGSPPLDVYISTSADYVMLGSETFIEVTAAGKTVTLVTPVGRVGKKVTVKNSSLGICDVISAAGLIEGIADVTIPSTNAYDFRSNNVGWRVT
jgi:hypothetical protein